ncbi:MAG: hypothetical protein D3908_03320 [Candidatus Electrothrix sp. AUS4]|nr:hypothetical protein [Candidatus Electrothrix sp. AUS4]
MSLQDYKKIYFLYLLMYFFYLFIYPNYKKIVAVYLQREKTHKNILCLRFIVQLISLKERLPIDFPV